MATRPDGDSPSGAVRGYGHIPSPPAGRGGLSPGHSSASPGLSPQHPPSSTPVVHDLSSILVPSPAAVSGADGPVAGGHMSMSLSAGASQGFASSLRSARRAEREGGAPPVVFVEPEGYSGDDQGAALRQRRLGGMRYGGATAIPAPPQPPVHPPPPAPGVPAGPPVGPASGSAPAPLQLGAGAPPAGRRRSRSQSLTERRGSTGRGADARRGSGAPAQPGAPKPPDSRAPGEWAPDTSLTLEDPPAVPAARKRSSAGDVVTGVAVPNSDGGRLSYSSGDAPGVGVGSDAARKDPAMSLPNTTGSPFDDDDDDAECSHRGGESSDSLLDHEGTEDERKCSCCPRDPRTVFCIGIAFLVATSLIAPIFCVIALQPLYRFTTTTMTNMVDFYTSWHTVMYLIDDLEDTVLMYTYFADRMPPLLTVATSLIPAFQSAWADALANPTGVFDSSQAQFVVGFIVQQTLIELDQITASATENEKVWGYQYTTVQSDISAIRQKLVDFQDGPLTTHVAAVQQHAANMVSWTASQWLRDAIGNDYYTTAAATTASTVSSLLQVAMQDCFRTYTCWNTQSSYEYLENLAVMAGMISGIAANVLNEIFSVIANPRGTANTLETLVMDSLMRSNARTMMLEQAQMWLNELEMLLAPYRSAAVAAAESQGTLPMGFNANLYFVLSRNWADNLYESVSATLTMCTNVQALYEQNSPVPEWLLTGAEDILDMNILDHELLYAASLYSSVATCANLSNGLIPMVTPAQAEECESAYNANPVQTGINELRTLVTAQLTYSKGILADGANEGFPDSTKDIRTIATVGLVLGVLVSLVPTVVLACCLRYRIEHSPLPFPKLLLILVFMYGMIAVSAGIHYKATITAGSTHRSFTAPLLEAVVDTLGDMIDASDNMVNALHLVFLVAGSLQDAASKLNSTLMDFATVVSTFDQAAQEVASNTGNRIQVSAEWLQPMGDFFSLVEDTLVGGFSPLLQEYMYASSLQPTIDAVNAAFDMPTVSALANAIANNQPTAPFLKFPSKLCWATMASAAANTLSATVMSLMALDERLFSTTVALLELDRSTTFAQAGVESMCSFTRLMEAVDPVGNAGCYVPSICAMPSSYGLLRSMSSGTTIFNVFDPSASDGVGQLLNYWKQTVVEMIPDDVNYVLGALEMATQMDTVTITRNRRFVTWSGIFVALALEVIALFTYMALFGQNFFGSFLR